MFGGIRVHAKEVRERRMPLLRKETYAQRDKGGKGKVLVDGKRRNLEAKKLVGGTTRSNDRQNKSIQGL